MGKGILTTPVLLSLLGPSSHSAQIKKRSTSPESYIDPWGRSIWAKDNLPFNANRSHYPAEFWWAWKRAQPVRADWTLNKNNKKTKEQKGIEATNLIRDYTFRFVNRCISGTIWILDYELPQDPDQYPTKFFFGTNAHVAEGISFDKKNPYKQILPTVQNSLCWNSPSLIFRETNLNYGGRSHFMPSSWKDNEKGIIQKEHTSNNVENWLQEDTHEPPYYYYRTDDVKLVYVATDFAGDGNDPRWGWCNHKSRKYISDFAVIEIDFKDQKIAKKITRDFHTKYHYKTGTRRNKAIDLFARPLMERMGNREMYNKSIDIFLAGHPINGLKGRSVGSFNLEKRQASKLTYVSKWHMIKDENNDEIIGHSNVCHLSQPLEGYETVRFQRGVEILLEHEPLRNGSSGSLTTDADGNAIGVKSRKWKKVSAVDVFRSPAIKRRHKIIIPAYDLLEGVASNPRDRSYMDSIVRKKIKTHLSEMRKWGTKDSQAFKLSKNRKSTRELTLPI